MNQQQRTFLINQVESKFRDQVSSLEELIPEEPEIEKHIMSAILSGTAMFKDSKAIKANITDYVKSEEPDDLISSESPSNQRWDSKRRKYVYKRSTEESKNFIKVRLEDIMEVPPSFKKKLEDWKKKQEEVQKKIDGLTAIKNSVVLKIQLASANKLQNIINEVDNMEDISLFSGKLTLFLGNVDDASLPPLIEDGKKGNQKQLKNK